MEVNRGKSRGRGGTALAKSKWFESKPKRATTALGLRKPWDHALNARRITVGIVCSDVIDVY